MAAATLPCTKRRRLGVMGSSDLGGWEVSRWFICYLLSDRSLCFGMFPLFLLSSSGSYGQFDDLALLRHVVHPPGVAGLDHGARVHDGEPACSCQLAAGFGRAPDDTILGVRAQKLAFRYLGAHHDAALGGPITARNSVVRWRLVQMVCRPSERSSRTPIRPGPASNTKIRLRSGLTDTAEGEKLIG